MKRRETAKPPNMLFEVLRAAVVASALSLLLILLSAFLLWRQILPVGATGVMLSAVKVLSGAAAGLLAARKCAAKGWMYGGLAGLAHAAFAFMCFSILSDTFSIGPSALYDLGSGMLSGMLAAMVRSALK